MKPADNSPARNAKPRRWPRWLLEITVALLVILLVQAWMSRAAPRGAAPDFNGVLLDGIPFALTVGFSLPPNSF